MRKTKIESEVEINENVIDLINLHRARLPQYCANSGVGYYITIYDNNENAKLTFYFGFGYIYKVKYELLNNPSSQPISNNNQKS